MRANFPNLQSTTLLEDILTIIYAPNEFKNILNDDLFNYLVNVIFLT